MALTHIAFLFDEIAAKKRIEPITAALKMGTARRLFNEALNDHLHFDAANWILNHAGARLFDIRIFNFVGLPYREKIEPRLQDISKLSQSDLGYWFLIILSTYLKPADGIGTDYSILELCLERIGWKIENIRLLINGNPTSQLFNNNLVDQPSKLLNSDPYWYWVRPSHSQKSGWLGQQQISRLLTLLQESRRAISEFDPQLFGNHFGLLPISVPEGQVDYLNRARKAYDATIGILETAVRNQSGIYEVICYT